MVKMKAGVQAMLLTCRQRPEISGKPLKLGEAQNVLSALTRNRTPANTWILGSSPPEVRDKRFGCRRLPAHGT